MTWGWGNDDKILIFEVNCSFKVSNTAPSFDYFIRTFCSEHVCVFFVFYGLVLQKDNNALIFLWQGRHTTVLKGLTYCLSEGSMRSSLGSPCPPGICPCPPFCDVVEPVAPHKHFLNLLSSFTPCIPPISPYLWISVCHRLKYKSFKPHLTLSLHRASYYEISIDDGPWEKQKSSGLSICTGTGSKAWWVRALFYSSDLTTPHKNVKRLPNHFCSFVQVLQY